MKAGGEWSTGGGPRGPISRGGRVISRRLVVIATKSGALSASLLLVVLATATVFETQRACLQHWPFAQCWQPARLTTDVFAFFFLQQGFSW